MTGSDLSTRRLALMEAHAGRPGPVVWLTACVHGDEVGGIVVVHEVLKRLRRRPLLIGSLYAFPLMNPIGFESVSRTIGVSREDLNRSFPGNPLGSTAERIANLVFSRIRETDPALVLDLHNDWIKSIPYTLIDPYPGPKRREVYEQVKHFARHSGFLVVNEQEEDTTREQLSRTLTGSLMLHDIPALTLELGEAYVVNEENVTYGVESVWSLLQTLDMVEPTSTPRAYQAPAAFRDKILRYSHQPYSATSGIVRFLVKPGDPTVPDQPIARIYNVFGKHQETLRARRAGVVLGHADSSVAFPGMPLVAFGNISTRDFSGDVASAPTPDRTVGM
jgi:predicted deacylase